MLRYEERTRLPRSTRLVDPRAQLGLQPTSGAHAILHLEGDKALVVDRVGPILAHDRLDRQVQLLSLERL